MSERTSTGLRLAAGLAAMALSACGGSGDAPRVAVQPSVELPASVPLGEPLDMGYVWETGADFDPPAEDYQVFVHMTDPQGAIVFQDDHYPPEPTSQWNAGATEEYRRWVYPPEELEVEYLDVVVGLYSRDGRAMIRSGEEWTDAREVHRLEIRADDLSGIPVFLDGWHSREEPDDALHGWRWTAGEPAQAVFNHPARDAILHLRARGPYDEVGPQTVVIRIDETEVASFATTSNEPFLERIEIPAEAMGDNDWVEFSIDVTPKFVPGEQDPESQDDRNLGLQVFKMYLSSS